MMLRKVLVGMLVAVTVTACGSGAGVPKTPAITTARACLHRYGMIVSRIPAAQLRSLTSGPETPPVPVAGLTVFKPGRRAWRRKRMLVAYFATPAAATAAIYSVTLPRGSSIEIQQAESGSHRGRVLLLLFDYRGGPDLVTMVKVKHCTMGVSASLFAS